MVVYLALLKGINVGGHKKITMDDLKELFTSTFFFTNVITYIQSGNVVFESSIPSTKKISETIQDGIKKHFRFDVSVILKKKNEVLAIETNFPFAKKDLPNAYVSFLSKVPSEDALKELKKAKQTSEKMKLVGKVLYLVFPDGYSKTKLSNDMIERKLGVISTTRNWNTVTKLIELVH